MTESADKAGNRRANIGYMKGKLEPFTRFLEVMKGGRTIKVGKVFLTYGRTELITQ